MARAPSSPKKPAVDPPPAVSDQPKRIKRTPELEIALAARIRAARVAAGRSQGALGEALGISWQQIQEYEVGRDRVAASTLQRIAETLRVHPGSFFDDDGPAASDPTTDVRAVVKLGRRIQRVRDPAVIKRLLALAHVLAEAENEHTASASDGPH